MGLLNDEKSFRNSLFSLDFSAFQTVVSKGIVSHYDHFPRYFSKIHENIAAKFIMASVKISIMQS